MNLYFLPVHTILNVENEDKVKVGTILARMPKPHYWGGHLNHFLLHINLFQENLKKNLYIL